MELGHKSFNDAPSTLPAVLNPVDLHLHPHQNLWCLGNGGSLYPGAQILTPSENFGSEKYTYIEWHSVRGVAGNDVLAIGGGNQILLYDLSSSIITFEHIGTYELLGSTGNSRTARLSMAVGNGSLYVSGDSVSPQIIDVDLDTGVVTSELIDLSIRDFEGVADGLEVDERPISLSQDHKYNLLNQGWIDKVVQIQKQGPAGSNPRGIWGVPIDYFKARNGVYASNADVYSYYLDSIFFFQPLFGLITGNTPSPKGHYVLDLFNQDRSGVSGLTLSGDNVVTSKRPTTLAFYAGRIWYGGIKDSEWVGSLYFSQVIKNNQDAGKCYQLNDPTYNEMSDLLATDGGTIKIPEAGNILIMQQVGNGLLVFAERGVWVIRGGEGAFSASNFTVDKVHDIEIIGPDTLVAVENSVFFWARSGIYALREDSTGFRFSAENITEKTIQALFNDISENSKTEASGVYFKTEHKVIWMYSETEQYTTRSKFNKMLIFDLRTGAFVTRTIAEDFATSPSVFGLIEKSTQNTIAATEDVTINGVTVTISGEDVVVTIETPISTVTEPKFLIAAEDDGNFYLLFGQFDNRNFVDWEDIDGVGYDYTSFFETGHENLGDVTHVKNARNIWTFFTRTEDGFELVQDLGSGAEQVQLTNQSSCMIQYKWDWSDSSVNGRWSAQRQAYRLKQYNPSDVTDPFDYGYAIIETRNKVRGRGKSLTVRFESETGKDMQVEGWAIEYSASGKES
jgi:hypothetical protein